MAGETDEGEVFEVQIGGVGDTARPDLSLHLTVTAWLFEGCYKYEEYQYVKYGQCWVFSVRR